MKSYLGYIITAVVTFATSWLAFKGTTKTATASTESAYAQATPELVTQIRGLIKDSQDKSDKITALTAQVQAQSKQIDAQTKQLRDQSQIMREQSRTIDAMNKQIGSLRDQFGIKQED